MPTLTAALLTSRNEQGEYIAKASHEIPTIQPQGLGLAIQIVCYVLSVFSTILICLRVYARSYAVGRRLTEMGWDDYLAVAGYIPFIPSVAWAIIGVNYGLGAEDSQIPEGQLYLYQARTKENMVYFELIYFGASLITKFSMALMILRLSNKKRYAYTIWGSLALMGVIAVGCLGVMFGNCQPFSATWNEQLGYCRWPNSQGWINLSYFGAAGLAIVDWACAITPFFILRNLQMPKRKKLSVQLILGLGLLGSIAGMIRIPFFMYYDVTKYPHNSLYFFGHTIIWTVIEAGLGIMACSLPPLRALFSKFYRGSSGRSRMTGSTGGPGCKSNMAGSSGPGSRPDLSKGSQWDRLDDDDDASSQKGIIRLTEIHIETSDGKDGRSGSVSHGHADSINQETEQQQLGDTQIPRAI